MGWPIFGICLGFAGIWLGFAGVELGCVKICWGFVFVFLWDKDRVLLGYAGFLSVFGGVVLGVAWWWLVVFAAVCWCALGLAGCGMR